MASVDEKGDTAKKKQWKTNEVPTRNRSRGKEKPAERKEATTPRSRSTPSKDRPPQPNARNVTANVIAKLTPAELEQQLQEQLTSCRFEDAAAWIKASPYLSEKYQLADVVRLVLDQRHFDLAGRLIREHKLAENQQLVTFFIMELVRSGRFHLAVRYAQELVPQFNGGDEHVTDRPMWTPTTLVMAMIRAQQYKTALKYAKQFNLETEFPVKKFVQGMLHEKAWADAFAVIMEHNMEKEFPIDILITNMLSERQWSAAIKSIKMAKRGDVFTTKVLVQRMIQSGDFLATLNYLKEFSLTDDLDLVRQMLNSMLHFNELYKAIKYSIKFGLASEPAYNPSRLIDLAIDRRQFHVASLYIKKLKLENEFQDDLRHIAHEKDGLLATFRALMARKRQRQRSPEYQARLRECLGDDYEEPEEEIDIVLSVEEEIIPRKAPAPKTSLLERLHLHDNPSSLSFLLQDMKGLGGSTSFADADSAFAFAPPAPRPLVAQPPLPPPQLQSRPPFPQTAPSPPLPRGPPLPPPPPPQSSGFYQFQPPLPSAAASLAMQFHVPPQQPLLPPPPFPLAPPLPSQPAKPHRTFVPSLSLKPSQLGPKHT
ncbi:hypothetical protein AeNC1_005869 [Aphanomyces euteiches]|nr:hypothetical protein AeNC1_005869 [Aphanomyces euteiches]